MDPTFIDARGARRRFPRFDIPGGRAHVGAVFTRWTVIEVLAKGRRRVVCSCGTERIVLAGNLTNDMSRSCGCLGNEVRRRPKTHGLTRTPIFSVWSGIIARCTNQRNPSFENYGGRGIDVCAGWLNSIEKFAADMGPRPAGSSIDRIDNDLGYHCGRCEDCISRGRGPNCQWATQKAQSRNTRNNIWIEIDGERLIVTDWAERFGISRQLISLRLKCGWDPKLAVTTPPLPASACSQLAGRAKGINRKHGLEPLNHKKGSA